MDKAYATVDSLIREDFVKRGDWTKERREILDKLSEEEIDTEILRLQNEQRERMGGKMVRADAETVNA
jgi:uncharacterized protein YktB (UPF0637 family)